MDPRDLIPQRPPFLFLDTIDELSEELARARYRFRGDEFFFAGHFPAAPIVPGVIQIEAMGQLMTAIGAHYARARSIPYAAMDLVQIKEAEFHRPLHPGDEMLLEVRRVFLRANAFQAKCTATVGGVLACEAVLRGAGVQLQFFSGGRGT